MVFRGHVESHCSFFFVTGISVGATAGSQAERRLLGPVRGQAVEQVGLASGELPLQLRGPVRGRVASDHQPVRPADAEAAGHVAGSGREVPRDATGASVGRLSHWATGRLPQPRHRRLEIYGAVTR